MRLTSVARMGLPTGRLRSYAPAVADDRSRELPVSFDQGRHVARGQRPGSWMAVAVRLAEPTPDPLLERAWLHVIGRHGTLRSVFSAADDGTVHLHEVEVGPGGWVEHEVPPGRHPREVLRALLDEACASYAVPSYRLCLVEPELSGAGEPDDRPAIVVASDHAHVDLWSLLVLVRDLATVLDDLRAGREPGVTLPVARPFAEHTAVLAAMPPTPEPVRARWAEILRAGGDIMPTFPLPLGDLTTPHPEVLEVRDILDADQLTRLEAVARTVGARVISVALSVMTRVTADLAGAPLRAVFPVHSRYEKEWFDAVGWFITNAVLECSDDDPVACAASVREAIELGSYPLGPIMAPYGGMPERPGMFALSWLDGRRLPVGVDPTLELQYVAAVIRTDGVMVWFVVGDDGLHLRCRYPDTPEARASVTAWLDGVGDGLRERAAELC